MKQVRFFIIYLMLSSCGDESPTRSSKISDGISSFLGSSSGLPFVYSLFYPSQTGQFLDDKKAKSQALSIKNNFLKNKTVSHDDLEKYVAAQKTAKASIDEVLSDLKKMSQASSGKLDLNLPESVRLNLALIGIQSRKFGLAEFYLSDLTSSSVKEIAASAFNGFGLIAFWDGRIPEAVWFFQKAIETNPSYHAALLNLGFLALKFGHVDLAKKSLSKLDHWYVDLAFISIARLTEDEKTATENCVKLAKKNHKVAWINCALLEVQNQKNPTKAKESLKKAVALPSGPKEVGDLAQRLLGKMK